MIYKGQGVSNGRAIAKVVFFEEFRLSDYSPITVDIVKEKEVLKDAINKLNHYYDETLKENHQKDMVDLVSFYKMLLVSDSIVNDLLHFIEKNNSALMAVEKVFNIKSDELKRMDNEYMRNRYSDILDVKVKLEKTILNIEDLDLSKLEEDFILVSKEITPSMLLNANKEHLKGIISEMGSTNSHIGILARSLNIPAVFGVNTLKEKFKTGDIIYLDGSGNIQTELDESKLLEYQEYIKRANQLMQSLFDMKDKKAITKDGFELEVNANVSGIDALDKIKEWNIDGVGLFRTEFLFMDREQAPSEEEQYRIFKQYAEVLKDKKIIIRTLDIGGDKGVDYLGIPKESNPFLGLRGIRYCLKNKELFKTQLRAILRASVYGELMIMYPMISSIEEIRKADAVLREVMNDLDLEDVTYNKEIKVGVMIETPSAVMLVDYMINEVDFFSIGTNDLVQYMVAVDRTNNEVKDIYDSYHPAVIRSLKTIIESKKMAKFVGLCGEMGANPLYLILLTALGIDEVSVNVNSVFKVKKYISMLNREECSKVLEHVLTLRTGTEIKEYLDQYAKSVFEDYYNL